MRLDDFDFELPDERIALRPARPRDSARLLVVREDGTLEDRWVRELPDVLSAGDVLVLNDTRVIPAALVVQRPARAHGGGGAVAVELNLHRRVSADTWRAFARPAKRLHAGDILDVGGDLEARVRSKGEGGDVALHFNRAGPALDKALQAHGAMPLPPYIARRRTADAADVDDYQTVYAREDGSVAAPTAGLHFTPELFDALAARGVTRERVTLHVGAGTFLPVKTDDVRAHMMHHEACVIDEQACERVNAARAAGERCVAVGTTSLRTLETAADETGRLSAYAGDTDLFILPGRRVASVDALLTNFHLPRSTLFMLVCAFSGTEVMKRAYAHAVEKGYRFYSYGDACLLFRPNL